MERLGKRGYGRSNYNPSDEEDKENSEKKMILNDAREFAENSEKQAIELLTTKFRYIQWLLSVVTEGRTARATLASLECVDNIQKVLTAKSSRIEDELGNLTEGRPFQADVLTNQDALLSEEQMLHKISEPQKECEVDLKKLFNNVESQLLRSFQEFTAGFRASLASSPIREDSSAHTHVDDPAHLHIVNDSEEKESMAVPSTHTGIRRLLRDISQQIEVKGNSRDKKLTLSATVGESLDVFSDVDLVMSCNIIEIAITANPFKRDQVSAILSIIEIAKNMNTIVLHIGGTKKKYLDVNKQHLDSIISLIQGRCFQDRQNLTINIGYITSDIFSEIWNPIYLIINQITNVDNLTLILAPLWLDNCKLIENVLQDITSKINAIGSLKLELGFAFDYGFTRALGQLLETFHNKPVELAWMKQRDLMSEEMKGFKDWLANMLPNIAYQEIKESRYI